MRMKIWIILMAAAMVAAAAVAMPSEVAIYEFPGATQSDPQGPLVADPSGNFYGVTAEGGSVELGTVYELVNTQSGWKESILYNFCSAPACSDGDGPSNLTRDGQGNLYGTTFRGGLVNSICDQGCGVVFEMSPKNGSWTYNVLYSFTGGSDGEEPNGGLILDSAGNVYGTDISNTGGTAFELSPSNGSWAFNVLYAFGSGGPDDGYGPQSGLIFDSNGNLYGTTAGGGSSGWGTAFKLSLSNGTWTDSILYNFCSLAKCADGGSPEAPLIFDSVGNLYGTTGQVLRQKNGTVFELSRSEDSWTESVLYTFCSKANCVDGSLPSGGVIFDGKGNLYGTTQVGGDDKNGTVFRLAPSNGTWAEKAFKFNGTDGSIPTGGVLLIQDALFGTTAQGGLHIGHGDGGNGVVFEIAP